MKKISLILAAALTALSLAGCGAKNIDVSELSMALKNGGVYSEDLTEVSTDVTCKRYGIDESIIEECSAYTGTRAVVDEIAVFKTSDASAVEDKVNEHISSQKQSYSSYRPDEVPKLDNAVVYTYNDYVILCISEDADAARDIIDDYTT